MSAIDGKGDGDGSFDPRTWLRPAAPAPAPPADPGFDIRNWPGGAGPAPAPEPAPPRRPPWVPIGVTALAIAAAAALATTMSGGAPKVAAASQAIAAAGPETNRRTLTLSDPSQLLAALRTAGAEAKQAQIAAQAVIAAIGSHGGDVRMVFDLVGPKGAAAITRLEATRLDGSGVSLSPSANGFTAERLDANLTTQVKLVRGRMDSDSFYTSAVAAGVLDNLIGDFTNAFSFDFDMQREIGPGDTFEAAYEQRLNPGGEPVGIPRLLYASLTTANKARALYRFEAPGDVQPGWYDGNGRSSVRSLIRTPLDVARITSGFGYRLHPIDGYRKLHKGTDFAAPIGTPVFAAGDATVKLADPLHGAAGNFVILQLDNGWQARYMHLSGFAPGLVAGTRVAQGQPVGEVGTTGHSTGPHLHFEVWINGEPVDSQSIDTGTGKTLSGDALKAFMAERDRIDAVRAKEGKE